MEVLNVIEHGFQGLFYTQGCTNKAVIVLGGSEGGIAVAKKTSYFYSTIGISALAVAYFRTGQTRKYLSAVPIEYIESAVHWLKQKGYTRIAIDGISKGAELALVAATLIPDICCVIARSPSNRIHEGMKSGKQPSGESCWTWRGKGLLHVPYTDSHFNILRKFMRSHEYSVYEYYNKIEDTEEALIKVENIKGPVLLLTSSADTIWPAKKMATKIVDRLKGDSFPYPYSHISYEKISHYITPADLWLAKFLFKIEREIPAECKRTREKAWLITKSWMDTHC